MAARSLAVVSGGKPVAIVGWIAGSALIAVACIYFIISIVGVHFTEAFFVRAPQMLSFVALTAFGLAARRLRVRWSWPLVAAGALELVFQLVGNHNQVIDLLLYLIWLALILVAGILMYREAFGSE